MEKNGFEFQYSFDSTKEQESYQDDYDTAYADAQKELLNKGYRIYTSIDLKKQKALQQAINTNLENFKEKGTNGIYKMQGAIRPAAWWQLSVDEVRRAAVTH